MKSVFYTYTFFLLLACSDDALVSQKKKPIEKKQGLEKLADNWQSSFDFDGDKIKDSVSYNFTGGANCCYQIKVDLSKFNKAVEIPFLVNGGYLIFDLSNKENFNIMDYNEDSVYEIFINLDHLEKDFDENELRKLKTKYSFQSNSVLIDLSTGKIIVKDRLDLGLK